jgi:hypothetical protein
MACYTVDIEEDYELTLGHLVPFRGHLPAGGAVRGHARVSEALVGDGAANGDGEDAAAEADVEVAGAEGAGREEDVDADGALVLWGAMES